VPAVAALAAAPALAFAQDALRHVRKAWSP